MKIGILSDTHDDIDNTNKAIDIFQENDVKSDNPHIQGFYFTFYPSGAVSGDHFF